MPQDINWQKLLLVFMFVFVMVLLIAAIVIFGRNPEIQDKNVVNFANEYSKTFIDYNMRVIADIELKVDGNVIFNTFNKDKNVVFCVGCGDVLKGIENGVIGMVEGETREFIIEPKEAYGSKFDFFDLNQPYLFVYSYIMSNIDENTKNKRGTDLNNYLGTTLYTKNLKCYLKGFNVSENIAFLKCQHKYAGKKVKAKVKILKIEG